MAWLLFMFSRSEAGRRLLCGHSQLVGLMLCLAGTSVLSAGIVVVETRESVMVSEGAQTISVYIDKDRIAIDTTGKQGHHAFIFRGDPQVMWMVDYDQKIYREATAETVKQIQDQQAQAKALMEARVAEQLRNMPPEQRLATEQAMQARRLSESGAGTEGPPAVFTKADRAGKSGRWECDWYVGRRANVKIWDVCTVDWSKLGFDRKDFETIDRAAEFFKSLNPARGEDLLQLGSKDWEKRRGYPGFPIQRISYQQGMLTAMYQVRDIRRQDFPDSAFEVPADFQKRTLLLLEAPSP